MATLSEVREDLAEALENLGLKTFDHVPSKIVPPCVLISTGDPYLEEGDTFNGSVLTVHLELFIVSGTATNSKATKALDDLISKVVLNTGDWHLDGVSAPFMADSNESNYLTSRLALSKIIQLTERA